tara:strand:- start:308 stop:493 length:186 start_codon:yes stop_codon:yes gene_type:complete
MTKKTYTVVIELEVPKELDRYGISSLGAPIEVNEYVKKKINERLQNNNLKWRYAMEGRNHR